jgi:hypothetical protein
LSKTSELRHSSFYLSAFFAHIFTGSFALILGLFQFRRSKIWEPVHKRLGKVYVFTVLILTAPAGFVIAFFSNGGIIPVISFLMLATLWWSFTFLAYRRILNENVEAHQNFMYRSYALTLSAVTLRLYIFLAAILFHLSGELVYVWVSVLCWVPNLLIAELLIFLRRREKQIAAI